MFNRNEDCSYNDDESDLWVAVTTDIIFKQALLNPLVYLLRYFGLWQAHFSNPLLRARESAHTAVPNRRQKETSSMHIAIYVSLYPIPSHELSHIISRKFYLFLLDSCARTEKPKQATPNWFLLSKGVSWPTTKQHKSIVSRTKFKRTFHSDLIYLFPTVGEISNDK